MFDQLPSPTQPILRLRVGFLAAGVLLALVMLAVSTSGYLRAQALTDLVTRGQAGVIRNALADLVSRELPSQSRLEAEFAELEQLGLAPRYLGVHVREGEPREVGTPSSRPSPPEIRELMQLDIRELDETVLLALPLHLPPPPEHAAPLPRPDRPPPPPGAHLIVEFEPVERAQLLVRARRQLATGGLGALVMLVISIGFWRRSVQAEQAEQLLAAQQRLAALGEMSAVLAHELRNPLASLKGHAQLLVEQLERSDPPAPRAQRKAARVVDEALRLEQLSEGLLAFVRIGEIVREPASPRALADSALADLDPKRVEIDDDAAPPSWALDGPRMRQVLTNLLANALQAAPEQDVELTIRTQAGALEFCVRDHGPGVHAELRERIFDPFVTTKTRGTGLGLAISRRIVELHGGEIQVSDAPDGGARFVVRIPGSSS